MLRQNTLLVLLLLAATCAQAELEIRSQADNPRHAAAMQRLQAASARHRASEAEFPSLEQTLADIQQGQKMSGLGAHAPTFASPSRAAIEQLDCRLAIETVSGVERRAGGFNGVMSVYACGTKYVVTYEYDYTAALKQRVSVIDEEFARHGDPHTPLIKTTAVTRGATRMTLLRWLNPSNEIRYEVHADLSHADDEALEKRLESVLRATALKLSQAR